MLCGVRCVRAGAARLHPTARECEQENGDFHIDGGLTNNAPKLTPHSVTVSPTCDKADVRPPDGCTPLPRKHFFLPAAPVTMREFFDRGFQDAKRAHALWVERGFVEL
mgnify:CR=1 FL=1